MRVTGTPRQSVGFPGANADPPPEPIETFSCTVIEQLSVSKSQVKIIQRSTNTQDTQKCAEAMCISVWLTFITCNSRRSIYFYFYKLHPNESEALTDKKLREKHHISGHQRRYSRRRLAQLPQQRRYFLTSAHDTQRKWKGGPWFKIKMSHGYRKSHCGDKIVVMVGCLISIMAIPTPVKHFYIEMVPWCLWQAMLPGTNQTPDSSYLGRMACR